MLELILIIFEQTFIYLPLIFGAYISFSLLKLPNLAIEAAYVTGAIFAYISLGYNTSTPLIFITTITASILGGACVGIVVHLIQTKGKIPHLLSSILTLGIFYGINLYLLGAGNKSLAEFANPLLSIPLFQTHPEFISLALIGIVTTIAIVFLFKTCMGYSLAIYGNNPNFFEHYGISTNFVTGFGTIISTGLVGLSGYLSAQANGFVDINAGQGISLFCITALILGKSIFKEKTNMSALVPLLGLIAYCALQQYLVKAGFSLKYFTLIQSLIVLVILINKYRQGSDNKSTTDMLGL